MKIMLECAGATRGSLLLHDSQGAWTVGPSASVDAEPSWGEERAEQHGERNVQSLATALPQSVFTYVLSSLETMLLTDAQRKTDATYSAFASDPYFTSLGHDPKALLCMPVLRGGQVFGVLYLGQRSALE